jgi:hypothetical protein
MLKDEIFYAFSCNNTIKPTFFRLGYKITTKQRVTMLRNCAAPGCKKMVDISLFSYIKGCVYSLTHGGAFDTPVFCPEHKERITSGSFSDGDSSTNVDLNTKS